MNGKWRSGDWVILGIALMSPALWLLFRRQSLLVLTFIFGAILIIRLVMILGRKLLWKIRNRLIFSSLFFTVTPIILITFLFYMVSSFLISQYNTIIFENLMQRSLVGLERLAEVQLKLKEPSRIITEMGRIQQRNPPFLKIVFLEKRGETWESFFSFPQGYPFDRLDYSFLLGRFQSGYIRFQGELHQGIAKVENSYAAVVFETINQAYFDALPHIGDLKVVYNPIYRGSIFSKIQEMTDQLDSKEFSGFDKYRMTFPYDFRYWDLDDTPKGQPVLRSSQFMIITDYSKLFSRLWGKDELASKRQEIRALQKEVDSLPEGKGREEISTKLAALKGELQAAERIRREEATYLIPIAIKVVFGLFAFFIILSIFIGFRIIRVVTHSVDQLTRGLARIRKGDFSARIMIRSHDQMHYLGESFNEMASGIDRLLLEEKEKQRLEEELRIARSIQLKLLPQEQLISPEFEIAAVNIPAQEIAGDYFDYFYQEAENLTVLVADVSGKGASAAFYMAELKGIVNYLQAHSDSPVDMIYQCHRSLCPSFDKGTFITMNLGRFDIPKRKLLFARAGHTPALYFEADTGACRELTPSGPAIGLSGFSLESIHPVEIEYRKGDILFFFSDGLSEMMNPEGDVLGIPRLLELIVRHAGLSAAEIRQNLLDSASTFAQSKINVDDLTFLVVKIR